MYAQNIMVAKNSLIGVTFLVGFDIWTISWLQINFLLNDETTIAN